MHRREPVAGGRGGTPGGKGAAGKGAAPAGRPRHPPADADDDSSGAPSEADPGNGEAYEYKGEITTLQKTDDEGSTELELGLGEGSRIFRAEELRDSSGRLRHAPTALIDSERVLAKGGKKGLMGMLQSTEVSEAPGTFLSLHSIIFIFHHY